MSVEFISICRFTVKQEEELENLQSTNIYNHVTGSQL